MTEGMIGGQDLLPVGLSRPPFSRMINFTQLNTPLNQVLMQIKDEATLTWLDKLKGDLNKKAQEQVLPLSSEPWA